MQTITKLCADHLRNNASNYGIKLKASHAHELVAAFFGYQSRAAMLAEGFYPVENLDQARLLIVNPEFIDQRRECLQDLPASLPDSHKLIPELQLALKSEGEFSGDVWICSSLEHYIAEEYVHEQDALIMDRLSGVMAETNAEFGLGWLEDIEVDIDENDEGITMIVTGQYSGDAGTERPFCGDKIDTVMTIELQRVAGRNGYSKPDISVEGEVNDDWVDPELRYGTGS